MTTIGTTTIEAGVRNGQTLEITPVRDMLSVVVADAQLGARMSFVIEPADDGVWFEYGYDRGQYHAVRSRDNAEALGKIRALLRGWAHI